MKDLQTKKSYEISHKIEIVDQTVKTINIEIIILDQIQIEATTQFITGTIQTQTSETDIIQMIVLETPDTIETETIQITGKDNIKTTDHETV